MSEQQSAPLYNAVEIPLSPSVPNTPYNSQYPSKYEQSSSRLYQKPPKPYSQPSSYGRSRPHLRTRPSLLDELIPVPITSDASPTQILQSGAGGSAMNSMTHSLRRSGSLAIIVIFLLSIVYLAGTQDSLAGRSTGLKEIFSAGSLSGSGESAGGSLEDLDAGGSTSPETDTQSNKPDFDQYTMLQTIPASDIPLKVKGSRLIFIGDIHGSLEPLKRLMNKISYNPNVDRLIHVGDLIAKGSKNNEVLTWMRERDVQGVRGNHDQPVIQWRAWMEWAGGDDWEANLDSIASGSEDGAISTLKKQGKMYPKEWEWKGEHWKIARSISEENYHYLLKLPLTLHLPSLHSIVVHAGLLPSNPLKPYNNPSQPLESAAEVVSSSSLSTDTFRENEELSILKSIPQNTIPWNLLNMRSIYLDKKRKGEITKSAKKGTPWSEVWGREMKKCTGDGAWLTDGMGEADVEEEGVENKGDDTIEQEEDGEVDEVDHLRRGDSKSLIRKGGKPGKGGMKCSPVTVIYGHAAGRGLDIKQFSKGIDTGCVYGRQLTVLILGDTSNLKGEAVRVDSEQGVLINVSCGDGGV